jgi:TetR/AcrR family transcriptional regulator, transcriptional repressor for nem operon
MTDVPTKLTPKGQQTRRRIVEAASRLIAVHGINGTTLEDVRLQAKVSSSQIYHYFADKQSLVLAVIANQESGTGPDAMICNFESVAALRAWGALLVEQQREPDRHGGCPIASLGSQLAVADGEGLDRIAMAFRRLQDRIASGYRTMQTNGGLAANADPDTLATMTVATVIGGLVLAQLNQDTGALAASMDSVLAFLAPHLADLGNAQHAS